MPNAIALSPRVQEALLYPVNIVTKPFLFVIAKVKAIVQFIFGYLVRLGVFSFGEWNHSWVKKKIIEIYKGGCYDTHNRVRFDPLRLQQAFAVLERVGGIRTPTHSKDGTKLDTMIVRYKDVKKKIEENGGKIIDTMPLADVDARAGRDAPTLCREVRARPEIHADVLIPAEGGSEKWNTFYQEVLLNLGLEKTCITLKNGKTVEGFILKRWYPKKPKRPKQGQCYIRCNAPTESYAMAKRDIMRHVLALRGDMLCFDYRGTWESEGVPTEGGYYLDGETMVEKAVKEYGYAWKDLWIEGFCLGGAIASHLKKKYHEKGINLFLQNTFDKMEHTLHSQVFPASHLAHHGLDEIKSRDPFIKEMVEQDRMDSVLKLKSLKGKDKQGVSIVLNTDTDTTIHKKSHQRLATAADQVSERTFSLMFDHPDKRKNGHSHDVFGEEEIQKKVFTFITAKDYPEILDDNPRFWGFFG